MVTAWDSLQAQIASCPYDVRVLPTTPDVSAHTVSTLEVDTNTVLGALVANTGGLLVDHGWLRVLGSGDPLDILHDADLHGGWLTIAFDVLGGQFAWVAHTSGAAPTVHYFAPDHLDWQDLEVGYRDWLGAMLGGSLTEFYATLRWPGWEVEVAALDPSQGISTSPPPWSAEGHDLGAASRAVVPLAELVSFHHDTARQLRG